MTKEDIRNLARVRGLVLWNKPSNSCLLTRLPYNTAVTAEVLQRVARAEQVLIEYGVTQVRARVHEDILRIEANGCDLQRIVAQAENLVPRLKAFGFVHVTLDLEGYRSQLTGDS
jgi:uncharacterized protein